jgi:hypothetical protein
LVLENNVSLSSLTALSGATFGLARMSITGHPALPSLSGLEGITAATYFGITNTEGLESLAGLENLASANNMFLASNSGLGSAELPALTVVRDNLSFTGHLSRVDLALPALTDAGCNLTVASNPGLEALDMSSLRAVSSLNISGNPTLTWLGSTSLLQEVETLVITGNESLPQCQVDAIAAAVGHCEACENNYEVNCEDEQ